jgi:hypothetical protein
MYVASYSAAVHIKRRQVKTLALSCIQALEMFKKKHSTLLIDCNDFMVLVSLLVLLL